MIVKHLQKEQSKAIIKIRAKILQTFRNWLNTQDFIEVQGPILIPAVGERTGFKVKYYDKTVSLSGGLQPYTDTFLEMFNKIYTVSPTFRVEPTEIDKHLIEFWRVEVDALNLTFENMLQIQEEMVKHAFSTILRDSTTELNLFHSSITSLELDKEPFPRLTYDEAIEKLQNVGVKVFWGEPLNSDLVYKLSRLFDKPFFIMYFPVNGETFFYKQVPTNSELTLSADLIAPEGYGEIASGGESITDKKLIIDKMNELELSPDDQQWYLSLRRFSSVPQSGFALGIERLLQWVCGVRNIDQTTLFPRTHEKIDP